MRPFLVGLGGVLLVLGWAVRLAEGGSFNLTLNTLRYFTVNRDWVYDATEKITLVGLEEPPVLNTKPVSRREVAWLVLEVLERIERDNPAVPQAPISIEFHLLRLREVLAAATVAWVPGVEPPPAHREWRPFAGMVPVRERTVGGQALTWMYWVKRWEARMLLGEEAELIVKLYGVRLRSGSFAAGVYLDGSYWSGGDNDLQASLEFSWKW